MEKLIKLLNKYLKTKDTEIHRTPKVYAFEEATKSFIAENGISYRQERVISKRFEFIKWLINEDKIDNSKFYDKNILKWFMTLTNKEKTDSIIMNLSIQENPISFLISVLK